MALRVILHSEFLVVLLMLLQVSVMSGRCLSVVHIYSKFALRMFSATSELGL